LPRVEELVRCRLWWPAVAEAVACGGAGTGGEMAMALGGGPSLFSPLLSFSSSLVFSSLFFFVRSSHSLILSLLFSALSLLFFSRVSPPLSCPSLFFSSSLCLFSASVFIGREGR